MSSRPRRERRHLAESPRPSDVIRFFDNQIQSPYEAPSTNFGATKAAGRLIMSAASTTEPGSGIPTFADVCSNWHQAAENFDRFQRLLTTDAKIAQTPR